MSYVLQTPIGDIKMDDDNFSSEEGQVWECHALWDDCDDIEDNEWLYIILCVADNYSRDYPAKIGFVLP